MAPPVKPPRADSVAARPYHSPVRDRRARETRARVLESATSLFVVHGYHRTTLEEVARRAGVSRPTVLSAFGSKPGLLGVVLDQALAGDDEPVPVRDRDWFAPVWEATTAPDVLAAYAEVCLVIARRAAPVVECVRRAADADPAITGLWDRWSAGRLAGAAMVVDRAVVRESLIPGLTPAAATDVLWTLNDPSLHSALVGERGWPEDRFRAWLAETMVRLLLGTS